jgi:hypothetical protein
MKWWMSGRLWNIPPSLSQFNVKCNTRELMIDLIQRIAFFFNPCLAVWGVLIMLILDNSIVLVVPTRHKARASKMVAMIIKLVLPLISHILARRRCFLQIWQLGHDAGITDKYVFGHKVSILNLEELVDLHRFIRLVKFYCPFTSCIIYVERWFTAYFRLNESVLFPRDYHWLVTLFAVRLFVVLFWYVSLIDLFASHTDYVPDRIGIYLSYTWRSTRYYM